MDEQLDLSEDQGILEDLSDPMDVEAFANLMANAHECGMSAADFVREDPDRTSRKTIRKLCLKNQDRSLWMQISSAVKNIWKEPSSDANLYPVQTMFGSPPGQPGGVHKNGYPSGRSPNGTS